MSSAVKLILGVSVLAMAAGFAACDNGGTEEAGGGGPTPAGAPGVAGAPPVGAGGTPGVAGAPPVGTAGAPVGTGGTDATAGAGTGGAAVAGEGVPLTPTDGWVAVESNILGVQGAMFSFGDETSKMGMTEDFMLDKACIAGNAALVDLKCTPVAPATDCYGTFWGAAIGLNLNQPIDPVTMKGVETPLPFDASGLKGFSFTVAGTTIPAPKDLRFKVEDASGEFCNIPTKKVLAGSNTFLFEDLVSACYKLTTPPDPPNPSAVTVQGSLLKIAWQVVTNTSAIVPFDFCISDVRAIPK